MAFNLNLIACAISGIDGEEDASNRIELRLVDYGKVHRVLADPGKVKGEVPCLALTTFCLVRVYERTLVSWDLDNGNVLYKVDLTETVSGREDIEGETTMGRVCNIVMGNGDAQMVLVYEGGDIMVVDAVKKSCSVYGRNAVRVRNEERWRGVWVIYQDVEDDKEDICIAFVCDGERM